MEIKSGQTVAGDMFKAMKKWQAMVASTVEPQLVFGGEGQYLRSGVRVTGWRELHALSEAVSA